MNVWPIISHFCSLLHKLWYRFQKYLHFRLDIAHHNWIYQENYISRLRIEESHHVSPQSLFQLVVSIFFCLISLFCQNMNLYFRVEVSNQHLFLFKIFNKLSLLLGKRPQSVLVKVISFVDILMIEFSDSTNEYKNYLKYFFKFYILFK